MEPRTLTYRKPWLVRAFGVIMILVFTSAPVFVGLELRREHAVDYGFLTFYALCCAALDVIFLWWSGPNDIYFDRDQKTYRYVKGLPFFAKTRTGPLSDLWGVYIAQKRGTFFVGVIWWGGGSSITLEWFSDRMKAEQFAAIFRAMLGLKEVMPPRNLRPRT